MILVVGSIASGRRTYVEGLGFASGDFDEAVLGRAPVLYGFEELLRDGPLSEQDFEAVCAKEVVVAAEVGCGVVPLDPDQRSWRERVGRAVCLLAEQAESVVRLVCGIPVVLK